MNIARIVVLLLLFPQQRLSPSLEGIVVKASGGEPLSKVVVELRAEGASAPLSVMVTENDGTFLFRNTPAGRYRLLATRPGYVRTEYGQRSLNSAGQVITLAAGQQIGNLRLTLVQTGSISGHITDRSGRPIGNATV